MRSPGVVFAVLLVLVPAASWAVSSIHGYYGSETLVFLNAVGEDQGNGAAASLYGGAYSIHDLPGDRWYVFGKELYKFYLQDGEDKEISNPPSVYYIDSAYSVGWASENIRSRIIGQTWIPNERYLQNISVTGLQYPMIIRCKLYEFRPQGAADGNPRGNLVRDLGTGQIGWGNQWAIFSPNPPRNVVLIPGKKYYVEFTVEPCDPANPPSPYGCQEYMQIGYCSDCYCDGEAWCLDEGRQRMTPLPGKDITMNINCEPPGCTTEYRGAGAGDYELTNSVYQTFTAKGKSLRYVHFTGEFDPNGAKMADQHNWHVELHEYTGNPSNPVGPKVGVMKRASCTTAYGRGTAVNWDANECPLVPGRQYLLHITKEDAGQPGYPPNMFIVWVNHNDTSGQGLFFSGGTYKPNWSLGGTFVSDSADLLPLNIEDISCTADNVTTRIVAWTTDVPSTTQVEYWAEGDCHRHTLLDETLTTAHSVRLTYLKGSAQYYVNLKSYADTGHVYQVINHSFSTGPAGCLDGYVKDGTGGPIVGAAVSARSQDGQFSYSAVTDLNGYYKINNMEPDKTYTISASQANLVSDPQSVSIPAGPPCTRCDFVLLGMEIVVNGGFEAGTTTVGSPPNEKVVPVGWPYSYSSGGNSTLFGVVCVDPPEKLFDVFEARTGTCFGGDIHHYDAYNNWVGQVVGLVPGRTYRFTAYYQIYWTECPPPQKYVYVQTVVDQLARTDVPNHYDGYVTRSATRSWWSDGVLSPWNSVSIDFTATTNRASVWLVCYQTACGWRAATFDDVLLSRLMSSLPEAKTLEDGKCALVHNLVLTATREQLGDKAYVETIDRVSGIQAYLGNAANNLALGDIVSLEGELATVNGERVMKNCTLTRTGNTTPLKPLARTASRLNAANMGILVRTWGRVAAAGTGYVVINDGGFPEGEGLAVMLPTGVECPSVGTYITVSGVFGSDVVNGETLPVLRVRDASDITTQNEE